MRNLFQRLLAATITALAMVVYSLVLALVISCLLFPGQLLRTLGTLAVNLSTWSQNKLAAWARLLDLKLFP